METQYICCIDLARLRPPFVSPPINKSASSHSEVVHPMEVQPFLWIQTTPNIWIFGSNDCARDLKQMQVSKHLAKGNSILQVIQPVIPIVQTKIKVHYYAKCVSKNQLVMHTVTVTFARQGPPKLIGRTRNFLSCGITILAFVMDAQAIFQAFLKA